MLFNSLNFAIFLPTVFIFYWFITKENLKVQNILLLASSYFFYACWDWRFLFLLIFSTLLDYFSGFKIFLASNKKIKLYWLVISIGLNLGFLGVLKYYNFFSLSLSNGLSLLGFKSNMGSLQLILPVGISFYTFHGLSYVLDIYKNKIKPERNIITYSVFVSFFPLLVAGPIERATHLLPQIIKKRVFNYSKAVDGLRQILWGLFKKIVIADNCSEYANTIFNNSAEFSGSTLVLGALFFSIQIYCDFSGYSDIALGTAKLFGFELIRNFSFPYFSRNIAEFWGRWHISLSSWFKDYLYIPLGGNKKGIWIRIRNTFIIFIASGFWHGANWTFIIWGLLNALYILPYIFINNQQFNQVIVARGKYLPTIKEFFSIILTFSLTSFAWIFFRASNVSHALSYISEIFSSSLFTIPNEVPMSKLIIFLTILFILIEWMGREQQYAIEYLGRNWNKFTRWIMYIYIVVLISKYAFKEQNFIYFQF
jgi:D-alanyl-lipoteichoic acid acyltransferase DltB (MBOAT superfamily)